MQGIIRLGDKTTHGGAVLSCSTTMLFGNDVTLFGEMLHRFFALYADVHLFNQLTLVLQPTGKRLRWKENHSQHVPG